MATNYDLYRDRAMEDGLRYQDFVVELCLKSIGLVIVCCSSRKYQLSVGESQTGTEIKLDRNLASTGNLWIEVAEKARPREGDYARSGIYRDDNSWLYIIGNYEIVYIFEKKKLKDLCEARRDKFPLHENRTKTSRGFLLHKDLAYEFAGKILTPNLPEKILKGANERLRIGAELYHIATSNPAQGSLFNSHNPKPERKPTNGINQ